MFRMLGKLYESTLVVGIVGMLQVMLRLSSTLRGGSVSSNETSFALVLAR
jgi:hypothetical protein